MFRKLILLFILLTLNFLLMSLFIVIIKIGPPFNFKLFTYVTFYSHYIKFLFVYFILNLCFCHSKKAHFVVSISIYFQTKKIIISCQVFLKHKKLILDLFKNLKTLVLENNILICSNKILKLFVFLFYLKLRLSAFS